MGDTITIDSVEYAALREKVGSLQRDGKTLLDMIDGVTGRLDELARRHEALTESANRVSQALARRVGNLEAGERVSVETERDVYADFEKRLLALESGGKPAKQDDLRVAVLAALAELPDGWQVTATVLADRIGKGSTQVGHKLRQLAGEGLVKWDKSAGKTSRFSPLRPEADG